MTSRKAILKARKKLKKGKNKNGEKVYNHRKSRYSEVIDQTLYNGREPELDDSQENIDEDDQEELTEEDMNALQNFFGGIDMGNVADEGKEADNSLELDSEEEERKRDDEEFKSGQKQKKKRTQKNPLEKIEDEPVPEVDEDEFAEAVKKGPKIKPVSDKDRLLPKELFANGSTEEGDEESEEEEDGNAESEEIDREVHKGPVYKICYTQACGHLTRIWNTIMKETLTEDLYKKCLVFIPEHVMDHLRDPLKLTDLYMQSYNCGGGISLLAMRGVFLLITKHNLHYPEFYPKLYSLMDPTVFNDRYKSRFFLLLNVFLSSTHIPEYIAGAFVKILSRLLHFAPQHSVLLTLKTMHNILARFPSLSVMYDSDKEVTEDPFVVSSKDLMKSKATQSSLWEVASIRVCSHEKIHKGGQFIQRVNTPEEVDIKPSLLELDYDDLDETNAESAATIGRAATNYILPEKFFPKGDPFGRFLNV